MDEDGMIYQAITVRMIYQAISIRNWLGTWGYRLHFEVDIW